MTTKPAADESFPAKLEILRAGVRDGRLDVLANMTARADEDQVRVVFIANGKRQAFTQKVAGGRLRFQRQLSGAQREPASWSCTTRAMLGFAPPWCACARRAGRRGWTANCSRSRTAFSRRGGP